MRFGLFGTGPWARDTHAVALAANPEAELVGIWGRDLQRAGELAARMGVPAFADADALIDAVDAVAVALAPDAQAEIALRAAAAGRHLLLDKPLALSSALADGIVDAVDGAGVRSVVFHTSRFRPEAAAWLGRVAAAGDWQGAAVTLLASIFVPGNPFGASPWRRERGALWDVGPHALDFLTAALGPAERVAAVPGAGDTVHLTLRHRTGASSTATLSLTAPPAATASAWWVYGPRGRFALPDGPTTPAEAFGHAIDALLRPTDRDADGPPPSDVHHGRDIVRLLEAAERELEPRR